MEIGAVREGRGVGLVVPLTDASGGGESEDGGRPINIAKSASGRSMVGGSSEGVAGRG
jgi:hypothetical protein